jgi:TetR/AcrR family transcriptional repressor of mexJK operon
MATEERRTRGRPKQEDVAEIDGAVLEIALQEFLAHGYGAASVTRMVRNGRISKTTVYSRFESKEQLFRAIMDQQIERLSVEGALRSTGRLDLEAGLVAYANRTLQISLEGDLLQVNRLLYSESHRFPELGAAAAARTELGIMQVSAFITECAAADGIPCRDSRAIAEAFIFMLRGWYLTVMLRNQDVSVRERQKWAKRAVGVLIPSRLAW